MAPQELGALDVLIQSDARLAGPIKRQLKFSTASVVGRPGGASFAVVVPGATVRNKEAFYAAQRHHVFVQRDGVSVTDGAFPSGASPMDFNNWAPSEATDGLMPAGWTTNPSHESPLLFTGSAGSVRGPPCPGATQVHKADTGEAASEALRFRFNRRIGDFELIGREDAWESCKDNNRSGRVGVNYTTGRTVEYREDRGRTKVIRRSNFAIAPLARLSGFDCTK